MSESILLPSDPVEAGLCYGALAATPLRERVDRMHRVAIGGVCGPAGLAERAERFRRFVARIAPQWLDEAEAMAVAAGVATHDLLALNALPAGFWDASRGGCTSALVAGSASAEGVTLLHKNRDLVRSTQDFFVRRAPDGAPYVASREVGTLGIAHFHSSRALAGANNTGSNIPAEEQRDCALACTHLLRLVAERAASCDQAVAVLEDAIAREVAGGSGAVRGSIFLFAEPHKGVVVELTSRRLAHREVRAEEKLVRSNHFLLEQMRPYAQPPSPNTVRRYERACERLSALPHVAPEDLVRLSRDHHDGPDSICTDDTQHVWMTVSAWTHVVHEDTLNPAARTLVSMGNPRNTLCLPVPRAIEGLPADCASGAFHDWADALFDQRGVGEPLAALQAEHEPAMARELAQLAEALRGQPPDRVRAELTHFVARSVTRVRHLLETLVGSPRRQEPEECPR